MGASASSINKKEFSSKIKLLLMGCPGVGKTSLISRYKDSLFSSNYSPSSGCSLVSLNVSYGSTNYTLLVMDSLSDSDLSLACRLKSIQNTEILAIVFDLSELETWLDVTSKLKLIKEQFYSHSHVLLIGNKSDSDRQVESEQINELISSNTDFTIDYIEVSAKTGENVNDVFLKALELGYYSSKARWDKIKVLLYAYKYSVPVENPQFSWTNLCEAVPAMLKRKKKSVAQISLLPPEVFKRLIMMI